MVTAFDWQVRVYYEDTDCGGMVYHSNYLKFLERARSEWLRAVGINQTPLLNDYGVVFVVKHLCIDYCQSARFEDLLTVHTRLIQMKKVSLQLAQHITCDERLLCEAEIKLGCINLHSGRPTTLPEHVQQALEVY